MTFESRHHVPNDDLTRSPDDPRFVAVSDAPEGFQAVQEPDIEEPEEEPKAAPKKKAKK